MAQRLGNHTKGVDNNRKTEAARGAAEVHAVGVDNK